MADSLIAKNFGILRWMYGDHKTLVEKLGPTSSWKKISDYTIGHASPDAHVCSSIEKKLELPKGWIVRDNKSLLCLSENDFALVSAIMRLDPNTKKALLAFSQAMTE